MFGAFVRALVATLALFPALAAGQISSFPPGTFQSRAALDASGGGGGNVNWTPTANPALQAGTANPQTFNSVPIGTAASNRIVIVGVGLSNGGPVTSVKANGNTITFALAADGETTQGASLWYANIPTGTTATDISVTVTTAFPGSVGILVGVINTATATPTGSAIALAGRFANDPQVTSSGLTVPSNGIGVVMAFSQGSVASPTWNTGTPDYNVNDVTSNQMLLGHLSTSGTPSISGFAFANFSIASATWGP